MRSGRHQHGTPAGGSPSHPAPSGGSQSGDSPPGSSPPGSGQSGSSPSAEPAGLSHPARARGSLPRRALLLGGLGLGVVAGAAGTGYELVRRGTLPGRYLLARLDGACGTGPARPAGPLPARHEVTFFSRYRRLPVTMVTLLPAAPLSGRPLSVVVGLHGAGADARLMAGQLAPAMATARITGFAVVTADGGDSYWHRRADGDDPAGMIIYEVLPRLAAAGLRTGAIGITGESMGGYGALLLAERLAGPLAAAGRARSPAPAAVAALSPAVFGSYASARSASGGAFDSQADFDHNNVTTGLAALTAVPALVSCGIDDPFEPGTARLRSRLAALTGRPVAGGILPGCHDDAFWNRNLPGALAFLSAHLD